MNITPGYYKTRDGRKARVLCTDAPGEYCVVGYVEYEKVSFVCAWLPDGSAPLRLEGRDDLIELWTEPKPKKRVPCGPEDFPPGTVMFFRMEGFQRSLDGGKTWLPCWKEVEE